MKEGAMKKTFWLGSMHALGQSNDVDSINLDVEGEGGYGFGIVLVQWREGGYAMQARVFSDAWKAFEGCPEVFKILADMHNCFKDGSGPDRKGPEVFDELVARLKKAGWKYAGRKMPRFYRRCDECGSEVKASGMA